MPTDDIVPVTAAADRRAAGADITAMRARLREAVNACTDLAMDQAVLILDNHRLKRQLKEAERSRQAWADIAYDMWELLGNAEAVEGQDDWEKAKKAVSARLTALIRQKAADMSFGPHARDHGPGTWSPQPDADGSLTLREAVGQAIGSASICWVGGTGGLEFDSTKAMLVHDGLIAFLSDWADQVRKQANQDTAGKMMARENWR